MRIALAPLGFINGDIDFNVNVILRTLERLKGNADFVIFGETFLQGFDGLLWEYEKDLNKVFALEDPLIKGIQRKAKETSVALSLGLFELYEGKIYDSQIAIDKSGEIIHVYRRISASWKESFVKDSRYAEGDRFTAFSFMGKTFLVALCGDLWYEDILEKAKKVESDYLIWPVYLDYSSDKWNNEEKHAYSEQAALFSRSTFLVNCFPIDKEDISYYSKGGACYFSGGKIVAETPSGKEEILLINL